MLVHKSNWICSPTTEVNPFGSGHITSEKKAVCACVCVVKGGVTGCGANAPRCSRRGVIFTPRCPCGCSEGNERPSFLCTYVHTHTHTRSYTHTHTLTQTTHTHTHTHTHTLTLIQASLST